MDRQWQNGLGRLVYAYCGVGRDIDETDGQVINPKEEFEDKQEDNSEN